MVYILIIIIGFIVRHVSQKLAMKVGSAVGNLVYLTVKRRRQIALKNLRMILKKQDKELENIARQSFQNMGKTLIELLRFPKYNADQILEMIKIEGVEHLEQAINEGKGIIVATAHFGNWELIFHVLASFTNKLSAVAQRFKNHRLDRLTNNYRIIHGGEVIEKKLAARQVLKHLRDGFCVVILSDQDAGKSGIFVDFMGVPASTAKGPVMFAMRTGVPILNVFDIRQDDGSHLITISAPMEMQSSGDLQNDVITNTTKLAKALEELIYKYPSQWLWMHNRWKTRPPE
jgi:KDO2-lipid IV(A) lauroyltransferase